MPADSERLIADSARSFRDRCAARPEPDRERIAAHVTSSLMLVTALDPHIGYDNAARIARLAHRVGVGLREAALELGLVSAEQFDTWLRLEPMTGSK